MSRLLEVIRYRLCGKYYILHNIIGMLTAYIAIYSVTNSAGAGAAAGAAALSVLLHEIVGKLARLPHWYSGSRTQTQIATPKSHWQLST